MRTRNDKNDMTLSGTTHLRLAAHRSWRVDRNVASIVSLLLALVVATASFAAHAGTNVSGAITSSTTWSVAGAPYTVTGDVTVNAAAVLTIEAGVTVYMNAGTSLVVSNGALAAMGTANAPVVITSYRDVANPNPAPAPGDWGRLQFLGGTIAGGTQLNYVQIKYGSGVALTAASPTFNHASILNHSGPAIAMDLQSSPVGSNNAASGNTLNGILVPAGDIAGTVSWGLTGIPYVVAQGIVGIGAPPITISPNTLSLNANTTGTLHVAVANQAPVGGLSLNVSSSATAVATVPSTVTIPQGATTVDVTVTAVTPGTSTITVSGSGPGSAAATVQVNSAATLALSPLVGSVGVGQTLPMIVTASSAAPAGGIAVVLSSTNTNFVTVPTPVTIPANGTSANFNATGVAAGISTITAQAGGYTNGTATITAQALTLIVPANLLVAPGLTAGFIVRLPAPAPAGGLTINLHSANTAIATVPVSVNIGAGATTANVNVTGVAAGNTTITASATGYTSGVTTVAVSAVTLDVSPSGTISLPQGVTQAYQIKLSVPAPAGGVAVNVASNGTSTATVSPSIVTVAQGQTLSVATVAVNGVATGATTLTLSSPGLNAKTVNISVLGQGNFFFNTAAVVVGKLMQTSSGFVQLRAGTSVFASPVPVTIDLTSSDASKVSVPATITAGAGNTGQTFVIGGVDLTSAPVMIDATSASGYASPVTKIGTTVVAPLLGFDSLDDVRATTSLRDLFNLSLSVPNATGTQVAIAPIPVIVSVTGQSPPGIIDGIYTVASGGTPTGQLIIPAAIVAQVGGYVGIPSTNGTYTVTASIPGVASAVSSVQTVETPALQFGYSTVAIGKGLTSTGITVQRTLHGQAYFGSAVTINLTGSDPSKLSVPGTVTIPATFSSVALPLTGVDLTSAPVVVDASAAGYTTPTARLNANVIAPQLLMAALDGTRTLSSGRDDFFVQWFVPSSTNSSLQTRAVDTTINLSLTNQNPPGLVNGLYGQSTGGNLVTNVVIPAGQTQATARYVDSPTLPGTYTITGDVPGFANSTSPTQTVLAPAVKFLLSNVVVGTGLLTDTDSTFHTIGLSRANLPSGNLTVNLTCTPSTVCSTTAQATFTGSSNLAFFAVSGGNVGIGTASVTGLPAFYQTNTMNVDVEPTHIDVFNVPVTMSKGSSSTIEVGTYVVPPPGSAHVVQGTVNDVVVTLVSSNPAAVAVPGTVTIRAGQSVSDEITIQAIASGSATITVSAPGLGSASASVFVLP